MLSLAAPVTIALGALLLFGLSVVLLWTIDLVKEAKALTARVGSARERIRDAAAQTRNEAERASERLDTLRGRGRRRRR